MPITIASVCLHACVCVCKTVTVAPTRSICTRNYMIAQKQYHWLTMAETLRQVAEETNKRTDGDDLATVPLLAPTTVKADKQVHPLSSHFEQFRESLPFLLVLGAIERPTPNDNPRRTISNKRNAIDGAPSDAQKICVST